MDSGRVRVAGKFLIQKKIGAGSFGDVFLGQNTETSKQVAIKIEDSHSKFLQLLSEAKLISSLKGPGIPKVYWYGTEGSYNIMVLELLGPSLEELYNKFNRNFSLKTLLMIFDQLLTRIELVHSQNFLHRDIKPDNFLIGVEKKSNILYIIDFGLSKKYRDSTTKQHIKFSDKRALTGTARYASINSHMGNELSRRDDIESIIYLAIYLFSGELPWQGISCATKNEKYRMIMDIKLNTTHEALCRKCPNEFPVMLTYVKSLRFEDAPDYTYLKTLLNQAFTRENLSNDGNFDWNSENKETVKSKKKSKRKKKAKEKPTEKSLVETIEEHKEIPKQDEVSTCIATSRWPEFSDREKIFSIVHKDRDQQKGVSEETSQAVSNNCGIL